MSRFNSRELERYETPDGRLIIVIAIDPRHYYSDEEEEHEDIHRDLFAFLNEQEILNEVQAMFIINYFNSTLNNKCVKLIFSLSLYKLKFWLNLYFNLN